jgi:hypothetical protein
MVRNKNFEKSKKENSLERIRKKDNTRERTNSISSISSDTRSKWFSSVLFNNLKNKQIL